MQEVLIQTRKYGRFAFSDKFMDTYKSKDLRWESHEIYRTDPLAIALFKEHGSDWCSASGTTLELSTFPSFLEYSIKHSAMFYGSIEEIAINWEQMYKKLLDEVMTSRDVDASMEKYKALKEAEKSYCYWR